MNIRQLGLVFNNEKKVHARQFSNGHMGRLTDKDITICNQYGFLTERYIPIVRLPTIGRVNTLPTQNSEPIRGAALAKRKT